MDKYEKLIKQGIRKLELQSFLSNTSDEVLSIVDDLGLVPLDPDSSYRKLKKEDIRPLLEELGFTCDVFEDDLLVVTAGEDRTMIAIDTLPVVSLRRYYLLDESHDSLECLRQAAYDITAKWDLVKSRLDHDDEYLLIGIEAMHEDEASFRRNIGFYLERIEQAAADLRVRHQELLMDRRFGLYLNNPQAGKTVS